MNLMMIAMMKKCPEIDEVIINVVTVVVRAELTMRNLHDEIEQIRNRKGLMMMKQTIQSIVRWNNEIKIEVNPVVNPVINLVANLGINDEINLGINNESSWTVTISMMNRLSHNGMIEDEKNGKTLHHNDHETITPRIVDREDNEKSTTINLREETDERMDPMDKANDKMIDKMIDKMTEKMIDKVLENPMTEDNHEIHDEINHEKIVVMIKRIENVVDDLRNDHKMTEVKSHEINDVRILENQIEIRVEIRIVLKNDDPINREMVRILEVVTVRTIEMVVMDHVMVQAVPTVVMVKAITTREIHADPNHKRVRSVVWIREMDLRDNNNVVMMM